MTNPNVTILDALLLSIALAEQCVVPITHDNDNGPDSYLIRRNDWAAILECAAAVGTPITKSANEPDSMYILVSREANP